MEVLRVRQVSESDKTIGRRNLAVGGVGVSRWHFEIKSANEWLDAQYDRDDGTVVHQGL